MSAQIIVLAQWKADHASIEIRFEPLRAWCAWLDLMTGNRRADVAGSGVVRAIGAR